MNSSQNVTVLVNSCDAYEDAWEPFFRFFKMHWPDCPHDIVLNTEKKQFKCDYLNVRTVNAGNKSWSKRILECLKVIDTDYVLFFLEDQFILKPVNSESWVKVVKYMDDNPDVGVIIVRQTAKQTQHFEEDFFPRSRVADNIQISAMAALYRKSYLKKLLRSHESPWEFEKYGSVRCKRYPEKVLQYNAERPTIFTCDDQIEIGYGIHCGKWMPKNKELFDKYGIKVDFENLGWMYNNVKSNRQMTEITANRRDNFIAEFLHNIKKRIKRLPGRLNTEWRKLRSLI